MIERIILSTAIGAGLIIAIGEVIGYRFITRLFCAHPPEQVVWNGGARMCQRCGKEVTLWE